MRGRRWTDTDTATLRRMLAVGYRDCEIAAVTGHATITVRIRRNLLGLKPPRRKDWILTLTRRAA